VIGTLEPDFLRDEFRRNKSSQMLVSNHRILGLIALFSTVSDENASDH